MIRASVIQSTATRRKRFLMRGVWFSGIDFSERTAADYWGARVGSGNVDWELIEIKSRRVRELFGLTVHIFRDGSTLIQVAGDDFYYGPQLDWGYA